MIDPQEAKKLNDMYDGVKPQSLEIFLEYMGLTEDEFNNFIKPTVVAPHKPNFNSNKVSEKPWDYDQWYREDNRKK